MTSISSALADLRGAIQGLVSEHATMREQLHSIIRSAASDGGRPSGRIGRASMSRGGPKKRGRAFKFSDEQAAEFRKRVEGGTSAVALAKELKISLPTMYSTLKRVGWTPRRGRPPARGARVARSSAGGGPRKRGRSFKFSNEQAADLRKQVEGGKSALGLAKELKISLPTMYNTLKRAGWKGTRGRKAKAA
jgi:DNA invertase Pin-like site-specific DNA recombinase